MEYDAHNGIPLNGLFKQKENAKNHYFTETEQVEGVIPKSALEADFERLEQQFREQKSNLGLFKIQLANDWINQAKNRPIPKMLIDKFWFQGEICILFADTNLGKSIFAVQIGESIAKGQPIPMFRFEAERQKVMYFDFELSDKQFETRYSLDYTEHYVFDENFIRAEINPEAEIPKGFPSFENYLSYCLEQAVVQSGVKVLIIDNLTYLKDETEKAKNALPLMKELRQLKFKYHLSILVLAHTPKRDLSKPINRNHLQGSKMLMNFCDSSFAIGESTKDNSLRYLKQIKSRNTEIIYGSENVILCRIDKPHNFLQLEFVGYGIEQEHLKQFSKEDQDKLDNQIIELKQSNPSLSDRKIAQQLGTNHKRVGRVLKRYGEANGT